MSKFKSVLLGLIAILAVVMLIAVINSAMGPAEVEPEVVEKEVIKYVEVPVEVIKYVETGKPVTASISDFVIGDYATVNEWTNASRHAAIENDIVTFTMAGGGNTGKYYYNEGLPEWRMYGSEFATLTIETKENYHLIGIVINYTQTSGGCLIGLDNLTYNSGDLLLINGDSVMFNMNDGQVKIRSFELIYCEKVGD